MDANFLQMLMQSLGPQAQAEMQGVASAFAPSPAMAPPDSADFMAPPSNVMQAAAASPDMPQPAPVLDKPAEAAEPPRQRRSLVETIGQIADAFAFGAGRPMGYQGTLDAADARKDLAVTNDLQRQRSEQVLDQGADEAAGRDRALLGQAVRGVQAIAARNGPEAATAAWPIIAQRMGIPEDQVVQLGQLFASDPNALPGIAAALNEPGTLGRQPFFAQGPDGELHAYQLGDNGVVEIQLPEGQTPVDPVRPVNLGGSTALVGRGGTVRDTLTNSERPGQRGGVPINERPGYRGGVPINERPGYYQGRPIAPAPASGGASGSGRAGGAAGIGSALESVNELRTAFTELNRMGAMVSPERSTGGNIAARLRASGVGQLAEGAVGTRAQTIRDRIETLRPNLLQTIMRATGMTSRQLDSNRELQLYLSTLGNTTSSYEANIAAVNGVERFLRENAARPAARAPARSGGGGRPASGGGGGGRSIPTLTPEQARNAAPGQVFRGRDGQIRVRR